MGHIPKVVSEHLAPLMDKGLIKTNVVILSTPPPKGSSEHVSGLESVAMTAVDRSTSLRLVIEAWPVSKAPSSAADLRSGAPAGSGVPAESAGIDMDGSEALSGNVIGVVMGEAREVERALRAAVCAAESRGAATDEVLRGSFGMMVKDIRCGESLTNIWVLNAVRWHRPPHHNLGFRV